MDTTVPPMGGFRVLDPFLSEWGIEARRNAHRDLNDVTDLLDDIEDRADLLLAELASILGDIN